VSKLGFKHVVSETANQGERQVNGCGVCQHCFVHSVHVIIVKCYWWM